MRLSRLAKILRVVRASRIVTRYDDEVGISFIHFRIAKYSALLVVSVHWFACAYRLVAQLEDSRETNWLVNYYGPAPVSTAEQYNSALYWAVTTMSSVGFGDIVPTTSAERVMTTSVIMVSACLFAFLLGSVTSLVQGLDVQEQVPFQPHSNPILTPF